DVSPVGMAANLHLGLAIHNFGIQEYMPHSEATLSVFRTSYRFEAGLLHPGETPGLGVELDHEAAAAHEYQPAYLPVHRLRDAPAPRLHVAPPRHAHRFPRYHPLADGIGGMGERVGKGSGRGPAVVRQTSSPAVIASASSTSDSYAWEPTAARWRRPSTSISIDSTS